MDGTGNSYRKHHVVTETRAPVDKLLYTPAEAAEALGIGRSTLYLLLAEGDIVSVRIGASRRIPAKALDAYIAELTSQAVSSLDDRISGLRSFRSGGAAALDNVTAGSTADGID
jgi:excisionase family DNA binding protein